MFNMHLSTYLKIQVYENSCHAPISSIWKYSCNW
jgi:hypothetical protein